MGWLSGWGKRIKLTIDNTKVDNTLSDFPVLIKLSNSSGTSSTDVTAVFTALGSNDNRKKIAVTTSNGTTQCYVEIERWDDANEKAELWIKIPSVSSVANTILYLYYDISQADNTTYVGDTTDTPAQSVWDSDFKLVMHMAQDPNGDVADAIKDSTSNANHGTPFGSMTSADLVDAVIGKGIAFDDVDDGIEIADSSELDIGTSDLTLESIIKTNHNESRIFQKGLYSYEEGYYRLYFRSSDPYVRITVDNNVTYVQTDDQPVNYTDNNFHYIVGQRDGDYLRIFGDGAERGTAIAGANTLDVTNDDPLYLGSETTSTAFDIKTLDELRISNIARSDAWLKATYYSNWDNLISFGSEQARYISGYVKEGTIPINRQIYLHNRNTGELIASTTSSGVGGYFYCETTYSGAHYVVCLDDVAGASYNDLIYGNIYPTTVSG